MNVYREIIVNSLLYMWANRTLYLGPFVSDIQLQPASSSFCVFLDGPATLEIKGVSKPVTGRTFLFPVDRTIKVLKHQGRVANIFLDPLGHEYHILKMFMGELENGVCFNAYNEATLIEVFECVQQKNHSEKVIYKWLDDFLRPPHICEGIRFKSDDRVNAVINLVKLSSVKPININLIARAVNLSETRLMILFKEYTGIPLRRYRLWHLMARAASLMTGGASLTDAAMQAGFSDAAHFCRNFKKHFGMSPVYLLNQIDPIRIHVHKTLPSWSGYPEQVKKLLIDRNYHAD